MGLADILTDLDQRQLNFEGGNGPTRIRFEDLDKYPVLKQLIEQQRAGMTLSPEARRQLRQVKVTGEQRW